MDYLLGVDIGTSGARAALTNLRGEPVFKATVQYGFETPHPGWAQQSGDVYWEGFCQVVRQATARAEADGSAIQAVCVSGLTPDSLPVDAEGNPLHPAILWLDRRATAETDWVKAEIGEDTVFNLNGNVIDPYFAMLKTLWLKNHRPDVYKAAHKIINVNDYIVTKLTGRFITDYTQANCAGVAFDIRKKEWNVDVLKAIGVSIDLLPEVARPDDIAGHVVSAAAQATGLPKGTPVAVGTADGMANYISAGALNPGENVVSLGTSGLWGVVDRDDRFPRGLLTAPSASDPDTYITMAALAFSGGLYKWLRDRIHGESTDEAYVEMDRMAEDVPPGANGLLTLPYLAGERTPFWDPYSRGVLFGWTHTHNKATLYRSGLEGVALAFLDNLKLMRKYGLEPNQDMAVTAGGAKSPLLRRILADALGLDIVFLGGEISAETGDAFIAGKAIGVFSDYNFVKEVLPVLDRTVPDPKTHQFYDRLYEEVFKEVYPRLKELFPRLYQLTASGVE